MSYVLRTSKLTTVASRVPTPARSARSLIVATPLSSRGNDNFVLRTSKLPSWRMISGIGTEVISEAVKYFPRQVSVVKSTSMAWRALVGVVIGVVVFVNLCVGVDYYFFRHWILAGSSSSSNHSIVLISSHGCFWCWRLAHEVETDCIGRGEIR